MNRRLKEMIRALSYFLATVLIVGSAKIIEIFFYDRIKPSGHKKKPLQNVDKSSKARQDTSNQHAEETLPFHPIDPSIIDSSNPSFEDTLVKKKNLANPKPSNEVFFQKLINSYLKPLVDSLPKGRLRNDIVIRYYKREKDGNHVYKLKDFGYYIHERKAIETKDIGTNVLIYGNKVDVRDIRIVAYILIKNGVPIRTILKSKYQWKLHALEVGANPSLDHRNIMTLDEVRTFTAD